MSSLLTAVAVAALLPLLLVAAYFANRIGAMPLAVTRLFGLVGHGGAFKPARATASRASAATAPARSVSLAQLMQPNDESVLSFANANDVYLSSTPSHARSGSDLSVRSPSSASSPAGRALPAPSPLLWTRQPAFNAITQQSAVRRASFTTSLASLDSSSTKSMVVDIEETSRKRPSSGVTISLSDALYPAFASKKISNKKARETRRSSTSSRMDIDDTIMNAKAKARKRKSLMNASELDVESKYDDDVDRRESGAQQSVATKRSKRFSAYILDHDSDNDMAEVPPQSQPATITEHAEDVEKDNGAVAENDDNVDSPLQSLSGDLNAGDQSSLQAALAARQPRRIPLFDDEPFVSSSALPPTALTETAESDPISDLHRTTPPAAQPSETHTYTASTVATTKDTVPTTTATGTASTVQSTTTPFSFVPAPASTSAAPSALFGSSSAPVASGYSFGTPSTPSLPAFGLKTSSTSESESSAFALSAPSFAPAVSFTTGVAFGAQPQPSFGFGSISQAPSTDATSISGGGFSAGFKAAPRKSVSSHRR